MSNVSCKQRKRDLSSHRRYTRTYSHGRRRGERYRPRICSPPPEFLEKSKLKKVSIPKTKAFSGSSNPHTQIPVIRPSVYSTIIHALHITSKPINVSNAIDYYALRLEFECKAGNWNTPSPQTPSGHQYTSPLKVISMLHLNFMG